MTPGQARKIVWRRLTEARNLKNRIDAGRAFPWEPARLSALVAEARLYHRLARSAAAPTVLATVASGFTHKAAFIHPRRRTL
jgi:hypothetical protein